MNTGMIEINKDLACMTHQSIVFKEISELIYTTFLSRIYDGLVEHIFRSDLGFEIEVNESLPTQLGIEFIVDGSIFVVSCGYDNFEIIGKPDHKVNKVIRHYLKKHDAGNIYRSVRDILGLPLDIDPRKLMSFYVDINTIREINVRVAAHEVPFLRSTVYNNVNVTTSDEPVRYLTKEPTKEDQRLYFEYTKMMVSRVAHINNIDSTLDKFMTSLFSTLYNFLTNTVSSWDFDHATNTFAFGTRFGNVFATLDVRYGGDYYISVNSNNMMPEILTKWGQSLDMVDFSILANVIDTNEVHHRQSFMDYYRNYHKDSELNINYVFDESKFIQERTFWKSLKRFFTF